MTADRPTVVVSTGGPEPALGPQARGLARRLTLPFVAQPAPEADLLVLMVTADGLELRAATDLAVRGAKVDFRSLLLRPGGRNLSRRQPLARAIGKESRTVVDTTAGLGHDAALLAGIGYSVTAVERSPVVAALLADGLERALADPTLREVLGDRLEVVSGDARTILPRISPRPDAIYIDPMYPPKRKASALTGKSIRLVRQVVGDDDDAADLLAVALNCATKRVVVKRPVRAVPLGGNLSGSIAGKLVRYDIHVPSGT